MEIVQKSYKEREILENESERIWKREISKHPKHRSLYDFQYFTTIKANGDSLDSIIKIALDLAKTDETVWDMKYGYMLFFGRELYACMTEYGAEDIVIWTQEPDFLKPIDNEVHFYIPSVYSKDAIIEVCERHNRRPKKGEVCENRFIYFDTSYPDKFFHLVYDDNTINKNITPILNCPDIDCDFFRRRIRIAIE